VSDALHVSSYTAALIIIGADSVIFTSAYLTNGIVDSFVVQAAMNDSVYSVNNFAVYAATAMYTMRFFGAPLSRTLLAHGRVFYATMQLALAACGHFMVKGIEDMLS